MFWLSYKNRYKEFDRQMRLRKEIKPFLCKDCPTCGEHIDNILLKFIFCKNRFYCPNCEEDLRFIKVSRAFIIAISWTIIIYGLLNMEGVLYMLTNLMPLNYFRIVSWMIRFFIFSVIFTLTIKIELKNQ